MFSFRLALSSGFLFSVVSGTVFLSDAFSQPENKNNTDDKTNTYFKFKIRGNRQDAVHLNVIPWNRLAADFEFEWMSARSAFRHSRRSDDQP
jgi:hypothetical protein